MSSETHNDDDDDGGGGDSGSVVVVIIVGLIERRAHRAGRLTARRLFVNTDGDCEIQEVEDIRKRRGRFCCSADDPTDSSSPPG